MAFTNLSGTSRVIEMGSDEPVDGQPIKIMVYGTSGTGKTYSLKTLPESMRPALLVDCDRGSRALWKEKGLGKVVQFDITGKNDVPVMYDQVKDFLQEFHADEEMQKYKTVVVDSYTLVHQAIMGHVMWKSYKDSGGKRKRMDEAPTLPEYGLVTQLALNFVQALVQLNRNLILVCHETAVQTDDVSGQARGGPALTPKLASVLPRYFDEILYSKTKGRGDDREYTWATKSTGLFEARSRFELPAEIPQDYSVYAQ
tara:strand:+ start:4605 stop:5372 length:768 start_codon:yes stop_codon:yes gene_type:complete